MADCKYKIILLGDCRAGKTSILYRVLNIPLSCVGTSTFQSSYQEKIFNICHEIDVKQSHYKVTTLLWDTAGSERFYALPPIYYRDAHCAIIVYDITDRNSFQKMKYWLDQCIKCATNNKEYKLSIAIVGNKIDLKHKRQVSYQEAVTFCESLAENDEYFKIHCNYKYNQGLKIHKLQLLSDGYLRRYDGIDGNIFIPLDIYRLCFEFYFHAVKPSINYFETSAKSDKGIYEMVESVIKTRLEIDYYHPNEIQKRQRTNTRKLIIEDDEEEEVSGIGHVFNYVSKLLSNYF